MTKFCFICVSSDLVHSTSAHSRGALRNRAAPPSCSASRRLMRRMRMLNYIRLIVKGPLGDGRSVQTTMSK